MRRANLAKRSPRRRGLGAPAHGESGQSLVLVTIFMALFFAIAAFVFDAAQLAAAHHQAQVAADAGALAAAQDMENIYTPSNTAIADGADVAGDNDQGANVTISQPGGSSGTTAKAVVTAPVNLPFGSMFGFGSGSVTAQAVAQVSSTAATVGDNNITDFGCSQTSKICTCLAGQQIVNSDGNGGYWTVTSSAEHPTTAHAPSDDSGHACGDVTGYAGESSVNQQQCDGGLSSAPCITPDGTEETTTDQKKWVVDLDGESEGGMWQTVTTVPGDRYVLTFWLTGNPGLQGYPQYPQTNYNFFPLDVYITDGTKGRNGTDNPYTPSYSGLDACSGVSTPTRVGVLACQYFPYHDTEVSGSQEVADFTEERVGFIATSNSTTITFNSETYDGNAADGSDYWFYCGPEVTQINLDYAGLQLVQ